MIVIKLLLLLRNVCVVQLILCEEKTQPLCFTSLPSGSSTSSASPWWSYRNVPAGSGRTSSKQLRFLLTSKESPSEQQTDDSTSHDLLSGGGAQTHAGVM